MRAKYNGCDSAHDLAKTMLDVTPQPLGRYIEEKLPPEWKDLVVGTPEGGATPIRVTERGVEFLGVCSTRTVSDDQVAEAVYQQQNEGKANPDIEKLSEEYTSELRKKANIVKR